MASAAQREDIPPRLNAAPLTWRPIIKQANQNVDAFDSARANQQWARPPFMFRTKCIGVPLPSIRYFLGFIYISPCLAHFDFRVTLAAFRLRDFAASLLGLAR